MHCKRSDRPGDDAFVDYRGTPRMRIGTGFIRRVQQLKQTEPCCCDVCHGNVPMNQLGFEVHTARHVVFNMEEAKRTKIDLFYDNTSCLSNERMKSVWVMGMGESQSDKDWCNMWCGTCDEGLGKRIEAAAKKIFIYLNQRDLISLGLLSPSTKFVNPC
ncbi:hypothetical protein ElyMa_005850500 [Elysia marginata]|uniref:Uncharacterized protein n=1 Tax=Elysia marginata TaxID=1093978 RepID=A0AAV4G0F9_9GAST|nr:hypothetical protein ElyMa_005850500 [Elysia marginata]